MKEKLLRALLLLSLVGFVVQFFIAGGIASAQSGTEKIAGWAWSSNIGWISFGSHPGESVAYSIERNTSNGDISGYGWSSGVGWVRFDPGLTGCPSGSCSAKLNGSALTGWGRACAVYVSGCAGATKDIGGAELGGWGGGGSLARQSDDIVDYGGVF